IPHATAQPEKSASGTICQNARCQLDNVSVYVAESQVATFGEKVAVIAYSASPYSLSERGKKRSAAAISTGMSNPPKNPCMHRSANSASKLGASGVRSLITLKAV